MADNTPGRDPLDDRLRATFNAERADIERRRPQAASSATSRSNWLPMAIAAALVMLAGFAWFGTRANDDSAIGLDVAGQPTEPTETDTTTSGGDPDAPGMSDATPGAVSQGDLDATAPTPIPPATSLDPATVVTVLPEDVTALPPLCVGVTSRAQPTFVWGIGLDDPDGGLVAHSEASVDAPVTRVLPLDAAVVTTGRCQPSPNGTPWFEIHGNASNDWASSNYLRTAQVACLEGKQVGAIVENGNPESQIFGPVTGWAIPGTDQVAFAPGPIEDSTYRWYPSDAVALDVPCFLEGPVGHNLCLSGALRIFDVVSGDASLLGEGEITARTTGRLYVPIAQRGLREELIEVTYQGDSDEIGFVDPAVTTVWPGECGSRPSGSDALDDVACTAQDSTITDGTTSRGSARSNADHVHNLRVEERSGCTRLVVEFGSNVDTGDDLADQVPLIDIRKTGDSTTIVLPASMFTGEGEAQRVDFSGGTMLFTTTSQGGGQVTTLHAPGKVNVWFLEEPARVIIDIESDFSNSELHAGPIVGEVAVLTAPIQADRYGGGIAEQSPFSVTGYARPFEARGTWYVLQADSLGALQRPISVVATGSYETTGWVDGWGQFNTAVPGLEPGFYFVLFGDHPPAGDVAYQGTGQYIRVGQSPPPGNERYFDAEQLPHIEIVDPFWD